MLQFLNTLQPKTASFRVRTGDLDAHRDWTTTFSQKLPAGSNFFLEMGHNGNGNIEVLTSHTYAQVTSY